MVYYAIVNAVFGTVLFLTHTWMMYFHREEMGKSSQDQPADRLYSKIKMQLSFAYLSLMFALALGVRAYYLFTGNLVVETLLPGYWMIPLSYLPEALGFLLFSGGFYLRYKSIKALGRFFTFEIGIRENHEILREGPYRLLRHPSYTGYLLMVLGFSFYSNSGPCLLLTFPCTIFFILMRVMDEEALLEKAFGEKFKAYASETWRLIPYIY